MYLFGPPGWAGRLATDECHDPGALARRQAQRLRVRRRGRGVTGRTDGLVAPSPVARKKSPRLASVAAMTRRILVFACAIVVGCGGGGVLRPRDRRAAADTNRRRRNTRPQRPLRPTPTAVALPAGSLDPTFGSGGIVTGRRSADARQPHRPRDRRAGRTRDPRMDPRPRSEVQRRSSFFDASPLSPERRVRRRRFRRDRRRAAPRAVHRAPMRRCADVAALIAAGRTRARVGGRRFLEGSPAPTGHVACWCWLPERRQPRPGFGDGGVRALSPCEAQVRIGDLARLGRGRIVGVGVLGGAFRGLPPPSRAFAPTSPGRGLRNRRLRVRAAVTTSQPGFGRAGIRPDDGIVAGGGSARSDYRRPEDRRVHERRVARHETFGRDGLRRPVSVGSRPDGGD